MMILILINYLFQSNLNIYKQNYVGRITDVYQNSFIVKVNNVKIYLLYNQTYTNSFHVGQKVNFQLNSELTDINEMNSNFKYFLLSSNVSFFSYNLVNVNIENDHPSLRNILFQNLNNSDSLFATYTLIMLFGVFTNDKIENTINSLGLSYLIVISGFHINLLFNISSKITNKNIFKYFYVGIMIYYLFLPLAALRSFINRIIKDNSNFSDIQSLSLTGILFLCFNPYFIFSYSLILSFISSYAIYLTLKKTKNKIAVSFAAFSSTLPIILSWNNSYNLLSPLLSIIISPIISFLYVLSFALYLIMPLWNFLDFFYTFMNFLFSIFIIFNIQISIEYSNGLHYILLLVYNFCFLIMYKNKLSIIFLIFPHVIFLFSSFKI